MKKFVRFLALLPMLAVSHPAFAGELDAREERNLIALTAGTVGAFYGAGVSYGIAMNHFGAYQDADSHSRILRDQLRRSGARPSGAGSPEGHELKGRLGAQEASRIMSQTKSERFLKLTRIGNRVGALGLVATPVYALYAISDTPEKHLPAAESGSLSAELAESRNAAAAK